MKYKCKHCINIDICPKEKVICNAYAQIQDYRDWLAKEIRNNRPDIKYLRRAWEGGYFKALRQCSKQLRSK